MCDNISVAIVFYDFFVFIVGSRHLEIPYLMLWWLFLDESFDWNYKIARGYTNFFHPTHFLLKSMPCWYLSNIYVICEEIKLIRYALLFPRKWIVPKHSNCHVRTEITGIQQNFLMIAFNIARFRLHILYILRRYYYFIRTVRRSSMLYTNLDNTDLRKEQRNCYDDM